MKDSELRGYILQYFYDRRRDGLSLSPPKPADLGVEVTEQDILYVCDQLGEHNYLEWKATKSNYKSSGIIVNGYGRINAFGIDVVEGNVTPAIKVEFVQHNNNTVTITGSTNVNNIIGSNNTLTLSELAKAIESATATPQEKEEAKTLLRKLLEHPLVSAIAGSAVGLLGS
jgi:hypothetical protein